VRNSHDFACCFRTQQIKIEMVFDELRAMLFKTNRVQPFVNRLHFHPVFMTNIDLEIPA